MTAAVNKRVMKREEAVTVTVTYYSGQWAPRLARLDHYSIVAGTTTFMYVHAVPDVVPPAQWAVGTWAQHFGSD